MIDKFVKYLNNIISMSKKYIIENNIKSNIRNSKISLNDAVYYRAKYVFADASNTFQSITSNINKTKLDINKKHKIFTRTAIYKKEKILPAKFYENIFFKTREFYDLNFNTKNYFIAIDGVYSNTNVLHDGKIETSMSLGFFDIDNKLPIDIHFTGVGKKNNECLCLTNYITENLSLFKNKIIICDRAYFCYSFFKFLNDNNIKFIIRIRDKIAIPSKHAKHYNDYNAVVNNENIRLISRIDKINKLAVDNTDKVKKIIKDSTIRIITNLDVKAHNDDSIINLYKNRWSIEEFYKQLKHNFKFQHMCEYNAESYNKNIYMELTFVILKKILMEIFKKQHDKNDSSIINKTKGEILTFTTKINENLILTGIKDELIRDIFYENVSKTKIINFLKCYVVTHTNKEKRSFERKSKRPFTKWYVKQYHDVYKIKKKEQELNIKALFEIKDGDDVKIKDDIKKQIKNLNKDMKELKISLKKQKDKL